MAKASRVSTSFTTNMSGCSSAETKMWSAKDKFKKIEIDADSTDLMSEFSDK